MKKMKKYWYLGFLGFIGLYKLPTVLSFFQGDGSWVDLLNLLWILWFFEFLPEKSTKQ
jgi:hypothetical protein